ncbi:hypothetical protein [Acidovorax sp. NCPPB 3576]|uniref:hypothetical protein n=1 Tax=Acidovorax sp. NCPPB 3576 TaxID=2940488 RepID=UPI00234AD1B5|nr:hypothetical protein [Acidovorax sp. NCPPB 3576]WCM88067.1 hypothetical protein M5C98_22445 [Acidovorax sp. NCPPB 3576]
MHRPKAEAPMAWWKRIGCSFQLLLIFSLLIGTYTAWWWIDSARTCETQDQYTLRGICLMRIQERAEQGDNAAQWAYGAYLETERREQEARAWQLQAMHGARDGLDLRGEMIGYCDRIPGFEAHNVEAVMLRVAQNSPDAHLRLLHLYTTPRSRCSAFDLDKAGAQIPLLTQCAHFGIADYLELAASEHYRVPLATRAAIRSNMALCEKELADPPPLGTTVREFMPVRREDLDALSQRLAALEP